jgi:hypothetical protein
MSKSKIISCPEQLNTRNANLVVVVVVVLSVSGGGGGGDGGEKKSDIVSGVELHDLRSRNRGIESLNFATRVL